MRTGHEGRTLTYDVVRRLFYTFVDRNRNRSESAVLLEQISEPFVRAVDPRNLGMNKSDIAQIPPEKVINCGHGLVLAMTEDGVAMLKRHPKLLLLDATFGTNHSNYPLLLAVIPDERGQGYPVAMAASRHENKNAYLAMLTKLKEIVPSLETELKYVSCDYAKEIIGAIDSVFPEVERCGCALHFDM